MKKVLVAMSGGVDSSVAAYLLKEQGYECIGVTMKLYENETVGETKGHTCCSLDDVEDARSVAYRLGMPYYVFDFSADFEDKIIRKFVEVYESGGTPNPCIDCNRYMKFDKLLYRARQLGCDYIATGHYAQIEKSGIRYALKKAADLTKDQSYVLYGLTQEQLAHTLFPLGGLTKVQVRQIAEEQGFLNAHKHDSQDICFVPDGNYVGFLERYRGQALKEGNFVDENGNVLGKHRGAAAYTIGQRKGLGLAMPCPVYVCGKCMETNTVTVGPAESLHFTELKAGDFNWIMPPTGMQAVAQPQTDVSFQATVQTRYRQKEQPVTVRVREDGGVSMQFDAPMKATAPGQAAVLYDGDYVLGGGTIAEVS